MVVDEPFRWILVAGFAVVMPVGLYHRIRSQSSGEHLDRRQEGWFILATLRPIGFLHARRARLHDSPRLDGLVATTTADLRPLVWRASRHRRGCPSSRRLPLHR